MTTIRQEKWCQQNGTVGKRVKCFSEKRKQEVGNTQKKNHDNEEEGVWPKTNFPLGRTPTSSKQRRITKRTNDSGSTLLASEGKKKDCQNNSLGEHLAPVEESLGTHQGTPQRGGRGTPGTRKKNKPFLNPKLGVRKKNKQTTNKIKQKNTNQNQHRKLRDPFLGQGRGYPEEQTVTDRESLGAEGMSRYP